MKKQRFGILLATLAILLLGTALLDYSGELLYPRLIPGLYSLLLAIVLITAVVSVQSRWRWSGVTIRVLVGVTILSQVIDALTQGEAQGIVPQVLSMLCLGYTIIVLLDHLMRAQRADADTINAAVCVFLLMGIFWALLHLTIASLEPGAFTISSGGTFSRDSGAGSATGLYYSFVTLTTLGYGDIIPVTTAARMSAAFEAMVGQIYMVVLVARLVGLSIAQPTPENRD